MKKGDQRLPHSSPSSSSSSSISEAISTDDLAALGIYSDHYPTLTSVDELASSRGYRHRDEITVSRETLGEAYDDKVATFFDEHLHEDEEIRYILDGAGYFDVRTAFTDRWLRLRVERFDLVILPAGIYHRFTTDEDDYIKALRLFKDEPKWTPLPRSVEVDRNPYRVDYLQQIKVSSSHNGGLAL